MRMIARAIVLTMLTIVAMIYVAREVDDTGAAPDACEIGAVVSGMSLKLICGSEEVLVQIFGLDAPKIDAPGCAEELAHGTLATERLQSLVEAGELRIERLDKGHIPPLVRLQIDGADVSERLVREGMAVASDDGARINWCEKLGAQ